MTRFAASDFRSPSRSEDVNSTCVDLACGDGVVELRDSKVEFGSPADHRIRLGYAEFERDSQRGVAAPATSTTCRWSSSPGTRTGATSSAPTAVSRRSSSTRPRSTPSTTTFTPAATTRECGCRPSPRSRGFSAHRVGHHDRLAEVVGLCRTGTTERPAWRP